MFLARMRLLLARRPWIFWCAVVLVACLSAWAVRAAVGAADRERRRWGASRTVWITDGPVARGEAIATVTRRVPVAVVPDDAVVDEPAGLAAHPLASGEIVVTSDLAHAPLPPSDAVVIAIERRLTPLVLEGDGVILIGDEVVLCSGAVARVGDEVIEVLVSSSCAATSSRHLLDGSIVMARAP